MVLPCQATCFIDFGGVIVIAMVFHNLSRAIQSLLVVANVVLCIATIANLQHWKAV